MLNTFTFNVTLGYGRGSGRSHFNLSKTWNWGPQEMAYYYIPAASTLVKSLLAWWRWRQAKLLQLPKKEIVIVAISH
jgi:hypothetical protein